MLTTQRHVYVSSVLVTAVQCKWMKNTLAFMVSKYSAGLYNNQEAAVRWNGQLTALFPIGQGTRQGCNVSPTEFNLYAERIMRTVEENYEGVVIGGRGITNPRYADDTTLLASTQERIKKKFKDLVQESARYNSTSALLRPGTQSRPQVAQSVPFSLFPLTSATRNL